MHSTIENVYLHTHNFTHALSDNMPELFHQNERPVTITIIDRYGTYATNSRTRTVQLCSEEN